MAAYLLWAIAGFVLIIAELVTGTFYLLVFGVAALVGALVAYLGGAFWVQAILTAAAALIGIYAVHMWWQKNPKDAKSDNSLEVGQAVVLEEWVNQASGTARVRYRGSSWDAQVEGAANVNDTLTIRAVEQGVLRVSAHKSQ
jgi:membrane protein implicated in regulation of membrane protease activity